MSNLKITELPAATTAASADVFPFVVVAGTPATKKITLANLKTSFVLVKADVGLGNVENTALSTWAGSTNLTTLGMVTAGSTGAGFTIALSVATVTGTLPNAAFPATLPAASGVNLTALTLANITAATTVGKAFVSLTNPSAITFPRANADNSVSLLSAADFKTALNITTFDPASPGTIGGDTPGIVNATTVNSTSVANSGGITEGSFLRLSFKVQVTPSAINMSSDTPITFQTSTDVFNGSIDVTLGRIGSGALAIRKDNTNQSLSIGAASGPGGGVLALHQIVTPPTPTAEDVQISFNGTSIFFDKQIKFAAPYGGAVPVIGVDVPTEWVLSNDGSRLFPLWAVPA